MQRKISALQAYRGFAALAVVAFHAQEVLGEKFGKDFAFSFFQTGHSGVFFFFVLSGFIIFHVHGKDLGNAAMFTKFAVKRAVRIYPAFWALMLIFIPIWRFYSDFGYPFRNEFWPTFWSVLLIHHAQMPHIGVAWTLEHEVLFYALFGLGILNGRARIVLGIWLFGSFLHFFPSVELLPDFFFNPVNCLFGLGILASFLTTRYFGTLDKHGAGIFFAGNAGFLLQATAEHYCKGNSWTPLGYGVSSMLIVMGCCCPKVEKWFQDCSSILFFGTASYSIYLVHRPCITALMHVLQKLKLSHSLPPPVLLGLVTLLAIIAGCAFYFLCEKPLLRRASDWVRRKFPEELGQG